MFGALVSTGPDGLAVSHSPFRPNRAVGPRGTLEAHLARVNPHAVALDAEGPDIAAALRGMSRSYTRKWGSVRRRRGA